MRENSISFSGGDSSTASSAATLLGTAALPPVEAFSLTVGRQDLTTVLGTIVMGLCAMLLWFALHGGAVITDSGGKDGADLEPSMTPQSTRMRSASPPPPPPPPVQSGEEGVTWPPRFQASLLALPFPGHW